MGALMSMSKVKMVLRTDITVLKAIPKKPAPQITIFSEAMNSAEKYIVVEKEEVDKAVTVTRCVALYLSVSLGWSVYCT